MPKMPDCKWYQRPDKVFLTVNVPNVDPAKADMKTTETNFTFKAEDYELAFDFFGEVDSEKATMKVGARDIKFCFPRKEEGEYWGKLNKGAKLGTLKTDFDNWKDEDELDGVDDDMSGFGGMPGMRFSLHQMAECITGKHAWSYGDPFSMFERVSCGESGCTASCREKLKEDSSLRASVRPHSLWLPPAHFPLASLPRALCFSLLRALAGSLVRSLDRCLRVFSCVLCPRLSSPSTPFVCVSAVVNRASTVVSARLLSRPRAGMGGPGGMGGMDMASMMQGMGGDSWISSRLLTNAYRYFDARFLFAQAWAAWAAWAAWI